ncbi:hypothetical protein RHODOSMS8_00049 [Rhodobiaceae bacterium]|nr:hypothetical protein RHODOSMS8_00049 [Rhodobiaceae bacterium]
MIALTGCFAGGKQPVLNPNLDQRATNQPTEAANQEYPTRPPAESIAGDGKTRVEKTFYARLGTSAPGARMNGECVDTSFLSLARQFFKEDRVSVLLDAEVTFPGRNIAFSGDGGQKPEVLPLAYTTASEVDNEGCTEAVLNNYASSYYPMNDMGDVFTVKVQTKTDRNPNITAAKTIVSAIAALSGAAGISELAFATTPAARRARDTIDGHLTNELRNKSAFSRTITLSPFERDVPGELSYLNSTTETETIRSAGVETTSTGYNFLEEHRQITLFLEYRDSLFHSNGKEYPSINMINNTAFGRGAERRTLNSILLNATEPPDSGKVAPSVFHTYCNTLRDALHPIMTPRDSAVARLAFLEQRFGYRQRPDLQSEHCFDTDETKTLNGLPGKRFSLPSLARDIALREQKTLNDRYNAVARLITLQRESGYRKYIDVPSFVLRINDSELRAELNIEKRDTTGDAAIQAIHTYLSNPHCPRIIDSGSNSSLDEALMGAIISVEGPTPTSSVKLGMIMYFDSDANGVEKMAQLDILDVAKVEGILDRKQSWPGVCTPGTEEGFALSAPLPLETASIP